MLVMIQLFFLWSKFLSVNTVPNIILAEKLSSPSRDASKPLPFFDKVCFKRTFDCNFLITKGAR